MILGLGDFGTAFRDKGWGFLADTGMGLGGLFGDPPPSLATLIV